MIHFTNSIKGNTKDYDGDEVQVFTGVQDGDLNITID